MNALCKLLCCSLTLLALTACEPGVSATPAANPEVARLIAELDDAEAPKRIATTQRLRALGPEASAALPELARVVREDPSQMVRSTALWAVGSIGAGSPEAIAIFGAALGDEEAEVRRQAGLGLLDLGEAAAPAREALVRATGDANTPVAATAHAALFRMTGDAEHLRAIDGMLRTGSDETRENAALLIAILGPSARASVDSLRALAADAKASGLARGAAVSALNSMGEPRVAP